jgi:hypothetical protein
MSLRKLRITRYARYIFFTLFYFMIFFLFILFIHFIFLQVNQVTFKFSEFTQSQAHTSNINVITKSELLSPVTLHEKFTKKEIHVSPISQYGDIANIRTLERIGQMHSNMQCHAGRGANRNLINCRFVLKIVLTQFLSRASLQKANGG